MPRRDEVEGLVRGAGLKHQWLSWSGGQMVFCIYATHVGVA